MGLDLFIRKVGKRSYNRKGQATWTLTEILALRNTWGLLQNLEIDNCETAEFSGESLWEAAQNIEDDSEKEIILEEFRNVKLKKDRYYQVYAWW